LCKYNDGLILIKNIGGNIMQKEKIIASKCGICNRPLYKDSICFFLSNEDTTPYCTIQCLIEAMINNKLEYNNKENQNT
jgi:hypothetical protein